MSLMTLEAAVNRIETASESSPLAVFRSPRKPHLIDVVFANTAETTMQIKRGNPLYVGTFDKSTSRDALTFALQKALDCVIA